MQVAVIDQNKKTLAPTSAVRARLLLKEGKAAVLRRAPLTIILKRVVEEVQVPDLRLKLDPGSRKSGVAIVNQASGQIVFAAEIEHRGRQSSRLWKRGERFGAAAAQERPDTASSDFSTGGEQKGGCRLPSKAGSAILRHGSIG